MRIWPKRFLVAVLLAVVAAAGGRAAHAVGTEPTAAQLRVIQTRVFATQDIDKLIAAVNDAAHEFGFSGETYVLPGMGAQISSYSCVPFTHSSSTSDGQLLVVNLNCIMRRLDGKRGISLRLSLNGMSVNGATGGNTRLPVDSVVYSNLFKKIGEAMFLNAQNIEPMELH